MKFSELDLREELVRAVTDLGFVEPTPVQKVAIPTLIEKDQDIVGLAQTGTGKTAAFGLPALNRIDENDKSTQAVIVCPTRELCLQIENDLKNFAKYLPKVSVVSVYGGANIMGQIRQLERGAQIIVATPGRICDLIKRRKVKLQNVQVAILDEADEMLNMGFKEDIDFILEETPDTRHTWLFSATMPKEVERISKNYMTDPNRLEVDNINTGATTVAHHYYKIREKDRYRALKRVLDFYPNIYGVVFCRTRSETGDIADQLIKDGYSADSLHGDLSQAQRDSVMRSFRGRRIQILVATDVAARGIDVKDITHVINYKLPDDPEVYTHRSGRTGRAGKTGISIAFVNAKEVRRVKEIMRFSKIDFLEQQFPSGFEICEKQVLSLVEKMANVEVQVDQIEPYLPKVMPLFEEYTKEEIIQRFLSAEVNHFLTYYKNAGELTVDFREDRSRDRDRDGRGRGEGRGRDDRQDSFENTQRFFINAGHMDNMNKGAMVRLICDKANVSNSKIGKIEIKPSFSFFEADATITDQLIAASGDLKFDGRSLKIEVTDKKPSRGGDRGDRGDRGGRGGRREGGYRGGRSEGGYRGDRGDRRGGGGDRRRSGGDRDRGDRGGRYERSDRSDRSDGGDRGRRRNRYSEE